MVQEKLDILLEKKVWEVPSIDILSVKKTLSGTAGGTEGDNDTTYGPSDGGLGT